MSEDTVVIREQSNHHWGIILLLLVMVGVAVVIWRTINQAPAPVSEVPLVEDTAAASQAAVEAALPDEVPVPVVTQVLAPSEEFGLLDQATTFISSQSSVELVTYYRSEIEANGGEIESIFKTPKTDIISARLNDGRQYVVYIKDLGDGRSEVTINISLDVD